MTQPARPRNPPQAASAAPAPLARLLNPLRHAAAAFFKHDIALRRGGDGLQIVFEQRQAADKPRPATPAELAALKKEQELALIRSQLGALLDELPGTRGAMRHLVFVEKALAARGLQALDKLPLDVLQRALEQFEALVTNWSPVGLAALRSKMAVAVIDRERREEEAQTGAAATSAVLEGVTLPGPHTLPLPLVEAADDEALAAAYAACAAFGDAAPGALIVPAVGDGGLALGAPTREPA